MRNREPAQGLTETRLTRPLSKALTTFPAKFACDTLSTSSAPPTLVLARFPFCTIFPFKPSELYPMLMLIYDHGTLAQFPLACARCFRFLEPRDANRHLCTQIAIRVCFSPIHIVKSGLMSMETLYDGEHSVSFCLSNCLLSIDSLKACISCSFGQI
jgi:hypothetical protein